jgi:uncharacterized protein YcfJ
MEAGAMEGRERDLCRAPRQAGADLAGRRRRPARDQIGLAVTADGGHRIWTAPGQRAVSVAV